MIQLVHLPVDTTPSGKCQYDPKHDMRAKSDAYQSVIYGNKNINDVEFTIKMYQVKSAIFADSGVRSLNTTIVEGPLAQCRRFQRHRR